jgi:hypothetical protein
MIVSNFTSPLELDISAYRSDPAWRRHFSAAFRLSTLQNYNAVGAFLRRPATTGQLRRRVNRIPALDPRRPTGLRYRISTL